MTTDTSNSDTSTTEQAQQASHLRPTRASTWPGWPRARSRGWPRRRRQARGVVDDASGQVRGQLDDQGRQQKDRLAGTLATFGDDLGRMADGGSGLAADLAHELADRTQSLSRHLDGREPTELLDDVRRFARQRPGTFLLGALAAGVVVGRSGAWHQGRGRGGRGSGPAAGHTPGAPDSRADVHASHGQPTQDPRGHVAAAGQRATPLRRSGTGLPERAAELVREGRPATSEPPAATQRAQGVTDDRSLGQVVSDLSTDLSTLMKQEVQLAKVELKDEVSKVGKGAGMLGGAGFAGWFVLLFLSLALTFLLDNWLPIEAAALITAGVWALIAAVLAVVGRKELQEAHPQLPQTQETLKEDVQWARAQKS